MYNYLVVRIESFIRVWQPKGWIRTIILHIYKKRRKIKIKYLYNNNYYYYNNRNNTSIVINIVLFKKTYFNKAAQAHAIIPLSAVDVVEQYGWICRNTRCHQRTFRTANCYVVANEAQQLRILSKLPALQRIISATNETIC